MATSGWTYQTSGPAPRPAADFDGDLKSEVLWHHVTLGEVWVWPMDGATPITETWVATMPGLGYRIIR